MKRLLLTLLMSPLTLPTTAWALPSQGIGSYAYRSGDQDILLDFHEANLRPFDTCQLFRNLGRPAPPPGVLGRLDRETGCLVLERLVALSFIESRVAWALHRSLLGLEWKFESSPPQDIGDPHSSFRLEPKLLRVLAVRRGLTVHVDQALFASLAPIQRAGLIVHEALYALVSPELQVRAGIPSSDTYGIADPQPARWLTAWLFRVIGEPQLDYIGEVIGKAKLTDEQRQRFAKLFYPLAKEIVAFPGYDHFNQGPAFDDDPENPVLPWAASERAADIQKGLLVYALIPAFTVFLDPTIPTAGHGLVPPGCRRTATPPSIGKPVCMDWQYFLQREPEMPARWTLAVTTFQFAFRLNLTTRTYTLFDERAGRSIEMEAFEEEWRADPELDHFLPTRYYSATSFRDALRAYEVEIERARVEGVLEGN